MKTGNTSIDSLGTLKSSLPQWSPVMKTGNTGTVPVRRLRQWWASMEPGHEDREYAHRTTHASTLGAGLNGARS